MERLNDGLDGDAVNEVLASLRVHSTVYCRSDLSAPWGLAVRAADVSIFHLITAGNCWLAVDGVEQPVRLGEGDVVLLMTGRGHRLLDDPSSTVEWLDDVLSRTPPRDRQLLTGGDGPRTEMICGCFQLEGAQASPLLMSLPPLLRLDGSAPATAGWLKALLAMLRVEAAERLPGGDAMLARLSEILITQAIRTFLVSLADADQPQVGALRDLRIAKAIRLFHSDPSRRWTVEEMAAEAGMSRSSFAGTFRQLTGESPVRYLTRCRLARAASDLAHGALSVFAVARRAGYDSEASLTKAFLRHFGMAPGAYRRHLRNLEARVSIGTLPQEAPAEVLDRALSS